MTIKKSVLILCTGNSCRSQMAEVLWRKIGGERWKVHSAGSNPTGFVHPLAIRALEEEGLPASGLYSKSTDEFHEQLMEVVVTVCDQAKKSCPVFHGREQTLHWPFDDPANATGTESQRLQEFRRVRDEIKKAIENFLGEQTNVTAGMANSNH